MKVTIQTRHLEIDDTIRTYAQDKFERVSRFNSKVQRIEIILKGDNRKAHCEAILHIDNKESVVIDVAREEIQEAIDITVGKCERQLRRLKEKETGKRRRGVSASESLLTAEAAAHEVDGAEDE